MFRRTRVLVARLFCKSWESGSRSRFASTICTRLGVALSPTLCSCLRTLCCSGPRGLLLVPTTTFWTCVSCTTRLTVRRLNSGLKLAARLTRQGALMLNPRCPRCQCLLPRNNTESPLYRLRVRQLRLRCQLLYQLQQCRLFCRRHRGIFSACRPCRQCRQRRQRRQGPCCPFRHPFRQLFRKEQLS